MSWLDDNWRKRAAISVHNAAGAGTADVTITIPTDWDEFWSAIDSSGNELRVTLSDGVTGVVYDVDATGGGAFSKASRDGRIRIDAVTLRSTVLTTGLLWLYYDSETAAGDGSAAVVIAAPLTGYIELGRPVDRRVVLQPQPPGLTRPQAILSKESAETQHFWIDFGPSLQVYRTPYNARLCYEEPEALLLGAVDDAGAAVVGLPDAAATRWVEVVRGRERRMFARVSITAGTSSDRYTVIVLVTTRTPASASPHRIVSHRFGLSVIDAVEPAA